MSIWGSTLLSALLGVAAVTGAGQRVSSAEPLRLVTGDDYPPYVDQDLPGGGWVTQLVQQALTDAGFDLHPLELLPWKRGLEATRAANTDGTFPWGYTEERAQDLLYSAPLFENAAFAWVRGGTDLEATLPALRNRPFCLPLGYVEFGLTRELIAANLNIRVSVPDMGRCFRMLAANRVEIVISTDNDALAAMAGVGLDAATFDRLDPPVHRITYHFVVARERPQANAIIDAVNAAIEFRALDVETEVTD